MDLYRAESKLRDELKAVIVEEGGVCSSFDEKLLSDGDSSLIGGAAVCTHTHTHTHTYI